MIKSFAHKGLARYAENGDRSKLPIQNVARVRRALVALHNAEAPEHLDIPGFAFHELRGARAGTYSIKITGNWRLTFKWSQGAENVNLEDYH